MLGAEIRSRTGSSAANWSRAAAASPAYPVQRASQSRAIQGVRVVRAKDRLADGQQRGELVAGPGCVARMPGPVGEVDAGGQGVRVPSAEDPNPCVEHLLVEFAGGRVAAARPR